MSNLVLRVKSESFVVRLLMGHGVRSKTIFKNKIRKHLTHMCFLLKEGIKRDILSSGQKSELKSEIQFLYLTVRPPNATKTCSFDLKCYKLSTKDRKTIQNISNCI